MPRPSRPQVIAPLLLAAVLGGCAWETPTRNATTAPTAVPTPGADGLYAEIAATALSLVGTPYEWGGTTPDGFDCSGLVYYTYGRHGVRVPRTAHAQLHATAPVDLAASRPGDLVFFRNGSKAGHVGILLGGGRFVHAPSRGKHVTVAGLNSPWYRDNLIRAGRLPASH